jgi:Protein of unknown function (DUF1552)
MADVKFLSRRRFLRGVAGVSVGLPLLESIAMGPASAQTASGARFVSFHCSSGVETGRFWPAMGPLDAAALSGRGTEALAPYASRVLIPRGVHGYPVGTWTSHLQGTAQALTAAKINGSSLADGVSIDQVIARQLNPEGREALVLKPGGRDRGSAAFNSISYSAPGQLVAAESDPSRAYRGMMGFGATAPNPAEATDAVLRRRKSVLDLVRGEFTELQSIRLSQIDRQKLEQHFQLVRDVEVSIGTGPAGATTSCSLDPTSQSALEGLTGIEQNQNFPALARLHVKLLALALACGYTRSAVLQWGGAVAGSPMYQWDGMNHTYRHHPLSHGTTNDFNDVEVAGYKDMLFAIDRWNIGEFKKLLDALDSYAEGEGRTLLDNTVVLYTNEFSHGQGHTTGDLPMIIAGGAGYFKLGQSILINGSRADIAGVRGATGNSNKLLATVLNAVGIPTSRWSDGPEGEFAELKA